MSYRAPPSPLPSERDFVAEAHRAAALHHRGHAPHAWADRLRMSSPEDRGLLTIHVKRSLPRRFPALAEVVRDALRHDEAVRRAAAAPCPAAWGSP